MTTAEILKFVLLAFGAGITLPLAIQLFLTLRSVHRTVETTSRRLNDAIENLELAAKRAQQTASPAARSLTAVGAALIPAIVAAVRAYRGEMVPSGTEEDAADEDAAADGAPPSAENGSTKGAPETASSKEVSHARA